MLLKKPPLFSFAECLWFLDRNYDECLYTVNKTEVRKALLVEGNIFLISVSEQKSNLVITVLKGETNAVQRDFILNYVADWFDIKTDMKPFYTLLASNKKLGYMAEDFKGLRLIGIPDLFEAL